MRKCGLSIIWPLRLSAPAAGVPDAQWRRLRERLRQHRILARTTGGAYVLARHPGQLSVTQLAALAPADVLGEVLPRVPDPLREMPGFADLESLLLAGREVAGKRMDISLEELLGEHPPAQAVGA